MRKLANLVSYVFHPVFMHFFAAVIVLFYHPYTSSKFMLEGKLMFGAITFINIVLLPIALMLLLKYKGIISSLQMRFQTERNVVYPILLILFGITVFQMDSNEFPIILVWFFLSICIGLIFLWLANRFVKVSMHTSSAGACIGLFGFFLIYEEWYFSFYWIIIFILLGGLIGTARLYLKAHKPIEIYLGYLIGIITTISTLWIITLV